MAEEFPANSRGKQAKAKGVEEKKEVTRVTQGAARRRKKPLGKRMSETFVQGNPEGVGGYVLFDVMIPAAKDMIVDAALTALERSFYGEARSPRSRGGSGRVGYSSHFRGSSSSRREPPWAKEREPEPRVSRRNRAMHNFEEIILETRAEADEVLDRIYHIVETYDAATVGDLLTMVGEEPEPQDDNFGWTDLRGAGITRIAGRSGGYLIDLPRPEPLD